MLYLYSVNKLNCTKNTYNLNIVIKTKKLIICYFGFFRNSYLGSLILFEALAQICWA